MDKDQNNSRQPNRENEEQQDNNGNAEQNREQHTGKLEWIFTIFSFILITSIIVYLAKESAADQTPAAFTLKAADPMPRGDFTAVDIFVENTGDRAAKAFNLKGEIPAPDGKPIEAEATIDWLPGRSIRQATLLFPKDAVTSTPKFEVLGHEEP